MGKAEWQRHADEIGYFNRSKSERIEHVSSCATCKARRRTQKANRAARERYDAMSSLGLTKTPYGWE